jgi:hypothetical protein
MAHTQALDSEIPTTTTNGITHVVAKREKKESQEPTVKEVVLGNLWVKPWYKSFYAEEIVGKAEMLERLYVCQWCFKYTVDLGSYLGHTVCCFLDVDGEGSVLTME